VLFRRKSHDRAGTIGLPPQAANTAVDLRSCPSLAKALKRTSRLVKPQILDLGPLCGSTAVYLANRGARVCVESFCPPAPLPKKKKHDEGEAPIVKPFRIDQPDDGFDLVLGWEAVDFTPPERLEEVVGEMKRLVRENGVILMLSRNSTGARKAVQDVQGRFRVEADDRLIREPGGVETSTRWVHLTREIERVLKPFSVQGIHLQRDQTREILALRKPAK
jgi:hypothetical protein